MICERCKYEPCSLQDKNQCAAWVVEMAINKARQEHEVMMANRTRELHDRAILHDQGYYTIEELLSMPTRLEN